MKAFILRAVAGLTFAAFQIMPPDLHCKSPAIPTLYGGVCRSDFPHGFDTGPSTTDNVKSKDDDVCLARWVCLPPTIYKEDRPDPVQDNYVTQFENTTVAYVDFSPFVTGTYLVTVNNGKKISTVAVLWQNPEGGKIIDGKFTDIVTGWFARSQLTLVFKEKISGGMTVEPYRATHGIIK